MATRYLSKVRRGTFATANVPRALSRLGNLRDLAIAASPVVFSSMSRPAFNTDFVAGGPSLIAPLAAMALFDYEQPGDILPQVSDLRRYNPMPAAPARSVMATPMGLALPQSAPGRQPKRLLSTVAFASPANTVICVRRKVRKEVILAKGKGGGRHRKPTRNQWSDISC